MQVDNADTLIKLRDRGLVRGGDVIHDQDGTAFIVLEAASSEQGHHVINVLLGRPLHASWLSYPVAVIMDEKRETG